MIWGLAGVVVLTAGALVALSVRNEYIAAFIAMGVLGGLAWHFGRCRHRGPLGLLPPTHDHDGTIIPARWFCDACGKTWPAVFERDQRPVVRFAGYDETKATAAARRAEDLVRKQRALAMRRAGIGATAQARRARPRPDPAEVVPIHSTRRFGP